MQISISTIQQYKSAPEKYALAMAVKVCAYKKHIIFNHSRLDNEKLCNVLGLPSRRVKSYARILERIGGAKKFGRNTHILSLHKNKRDTFIDIPKQVIFKLSVKELSFYIYGKLMAFEASKQKFLIDKRLTSSHMESPVSLKQFHEAKRAKKYLEKRDYADSGCELTDFRKDVHFTVETLKSLTNSSSRFFYHSTSFLKRKKLLEVKQNKTCIGKYGYKRGYSKNSHNSYITYNGWEYLVQPNTYIFSI